ncbi:AGBL3 [Branchiostoma lanceolatum]|uniref:AGBL3 protein n=1 Tax=Branchiostoma lanceolatum TaxID=7740 RepID=A0A8J9Z5J1_BRALA|nr:AGBL3 [Branchiostoma lanceolatum]
MCTCAFHMRVHRAETAAAASPYGSLHDSNNTTTFSARTPRSSPLHPAKNGYGNSSSSEDEESDKMENSGKLPSVRPHTMSNGDEFTNNTDGTFWQGMLDSDNQEHNRFYGEEERTELARDDLFPHKSDNSKSTFQKFWPHVFQHRTINDNDPTRFPRPWRGKVVVFDSERMAKGQVPHNVPEGCCPSLSFESRFESGNLRQARRIGQYEYELVLKTDLYTSRHTQWFYFRIQNALPGITYKFQIVNLLKRDSLYNYGMRPLVYSDRMARDRTIGWHRSGHHISYYQFYNTSRNPLLQPDINYFCLEWQMEFPYEEDTYYLAHCYPYTYTDLKEHLDDLCNSEETGRHVRRDVLCETRAGNSCFLLTITEFPDEESKLNLRQACHRGKKGVVVSARVHPGETQASWMMKGLLDFLTGESETAKELRENFIFKIVPMLNPDGVIVGNYRCSLAARDLNRNYRNPRKEIFPTVYYIKEMTEAFKRDHEIIVYCDLHGHSRKPNVFMYGCNSIQGRMGLDGAEVFINERLFPWLMAQKAPDKFAFGGCKFQIKKCKESTGRVVMWRTGIMNSFTMEATFCGTEKLGSGPPRHFNIKDFQDIGKTFCEVVLDYIKAKENKSYVQAVMLEHITICIIVLCGDLMGHIT